MCEKMAQDWRARSNLDPGNSGSEMRDWSFQRVCLFAGGPALGLGGPLLGVESVSTEGCNAVAGLTTLL